jgi:predicted RNA polymerase sigma factor
MTTPCLSRPGAFEDWAFEDWAFEDRAFKDRAIEDDGLRLIFTCCHPALAMEARIALTLCAWSAA